MSRLLATVLLLAATLIAGCRGRSEIVVFHAASLSRVFMELAERFEREHPKYLVRAEPSGSQIAARKVSELGLRADLVAVADIRVLDQLLVPGHADWSLGFATNEIVLAHAAHSRFTEEVTGENWPEVLARPSVRLGRVDPDLAPIGYQILLAWQLADKGGAGAGIAARLSARCAPEHVVSDESELVALLESRAIDYAFLYRSTAEDHRLKVTQLSPDVNLSRPERADEYAAAAVEVRMKSGAPKKRIQGAPLVYGFSIPRDAPNRDGALLLAKFILGQAGRTALLRAGFRPMSPARSAAVDRLPPELRALSEAQR